MTEEIKAALHKTLTRRVNARKPLCLWHLWGLSLHSESGNSTFYGKTLTTNVNSFSCFQSIFCLHQKSEGSQTMEEIT